MAERIVIATTNMQELEVFLASLEEYTTIEWVSHEKPTKVLKSDEFEFCTQRWFDRGRLILFFILGNTMTYDTYSYSDIKDTYTLNRDTIFYKKGIFNQDYFIEHMRD